MPKDKGPTRDEKVYAVIESIVNEIKLARQITDIYYRSDYLDYQIILDNHYHCEIREKLIETYFENKDEDIKREIVFLLEHAEKYEEWEDKSPQQPTKPPESDIVIDDSEKYDF